MVRLTDTSAAYENIFYETLTNVATSFLAPTERWNSLLASLYSADITTISTTAPFINLSASTFFTLNIFVIIGFLIIFYISVFGLKAFAFFGKNFDTSFTIFTYFGDLEEEMGAADDAMFYFLIIAFVIVWFFFITQFSVIFLKHLSGILTLLALSVTAAFIIPAAVLKNFGLAFVSYVRGHGRSSSIFYEAVLDLLSVSIIFLRFIVQNMRFIFIFFTFFELYEFVYQGVSPVTTLSLNVDLSNYAWHEACTYLITNWGLYLYYLGHSTIIFIAQLSVYFALSFWLFFFLYTTFTLEATEKYFFFKRAIA